MQQKGFCIEECITTWTLVPSPLKVAVCGKFSFDSGPSLVANEVSYLQQNKTSTEDKYTTSYGKVSVYVGVCMAETKGEAPFLVFHHASVLLTFCCFLLQSHI